MDKNKARIYAKGFTPLENAPRLAAGSGGSIRARGLMPRASSLTGFTLIELLVVISIIGLLASTVFASVNSARAKARDARRLADVKQIGLALELYYDATGSYPDETIADGSLAGWEVSTRGNFMEYLQPYLARSPVDPFNRDTGTVNMFFTPRPNDNNFF